MGGVWYGVDMVTLHDKLLVHGRKAKEGKLLGLGGRIAKSILPAVSLVVLIFFWEGLLLG